MNPFLASVFHQPSTKCTDVLKLSVDDMYTWLRALDDRLRKDLEGLDLGGNRPEFHSGFVLFGLLQEVAQLVCPS